MQLINSHIDKMYEFPTENDIDVVAISKRSENPILSIEESLIQARYELEELLPRSKKIATNGLKP